MAARKTQRRHVAPRALYRRVDVLRRNIITTMTGRGAYAGPSDVYRLVEAARKLERARWEGRRNG